MMSPKRRPQSQFVPISSVLDNVLKQYRPSVDRSLIHVWDIWETAVGSDIATNARPAAFNNRTLLVHVSNSTWLHHLRFLEKDLVSKLNEILGMNTVSSLKFKIGSV